MSILGHGWWTYAALLVAGFAMTAPWRAAGVVLARNLDVESELFKWVRAVSTALVAGLVTRMLVFPAGALGEVAMPIRLGAFLGGIAIFYLSRRNLGLGIFGAVALFLAAAFFVPDLPIPGWISIRR